MDTISDVLKQLFPLNMLTSKFPIMFLVVAVSTLSLISAPEKLRHEIAKKDKERDNEIEFLKGQLETQFDQSMPLEEERSKKCKLSDIAPSNTRWQTLRDLKTVEMNFSEFLLAT